MNGLVLSFVGKYFCGKLWNLRSHIILQKYLFFIFQLHINWSSNSFILSLKMQIRNNWENIIFTACKWCKLHKYYVNSMVISCSTCQKKKKNALWLNMLFMQSWGNLNCVVSYAIFPPNPKSKNFRIDKKYAYYNSGFGPLYILKLRQRRRWPAAAIQGNRMFRWILQGRSQTEILTSGNNIVSTGCSLNIG